MDLITKSDQAVRAVHRSLDPFNRILQRRSGIIAITTTAYIVSNCSIKNKIRNNNKAFLVFEYNHFFLFFIKGVLNKLWLLDIFLR